MYHVDEAYRGPAPRHGTQIHSASDATHSVQVYADGNLRTLTLGSPVAQSCVDLARLERPVFRYTQAMLLSLLLRPDPRQATLLGLGGGSLIHSLLALLPGCRITAVERSELVLAAARSYFQVPVHPDLRIVIADAARYLASDSEAADLLLTDLYDARGMDAAQETDKFFTDLLTSLAPGALAVFNLWSHNYYQEEHMLEQVQSRFGGQVLTLRVEGGNCLCFAFPEGFEPPRRKPFFESALRLGKTLNIPLHRLARTLWGQNSHFLR